METVRYSRIEPYTPLGGGPFRPYLPVRLQNGGQFIDTVGLVDSGADVSFFNLQFAAVLGLALDPTKATTTQGVGGQAQCWEFDIHLTVLGKRFPGRVGFSSTWPPVFGLLGRADFFGAFQVGIDEIRQRALFHPSPASPMP
jgi:hypothetical protein